MDVTFLGSVTDHPGPFATVCADVTHITENADAELDLRVRALADRLTEQGAPEAVVAAVRGRLIEGNDGGEAGTYRGRAVVAGPDGTVLFDAPLAAAPRAETAEWSPMPDLVTVLRALPGRIPHIVVVADRVGADITVATAPGLPSQEKTVEGDTRLMQKVKVGGWSHHRYQHTAENVWIHNMQQVIDEIDELVEESGTRFVLLAGDIRARQIFTDRATPKIKAVLVDMDEGGRAEGADRSVIDERVQELLAEHEAAEDASVLEQISAASAHGLALTGTALVVEALRKAQVETLVLAEEQDDEQLFVGTSPLEVGVSTEDMAALGITDAARVPVERALLRAAVGSNAGVVVLPRSAMPGDIPVAAVLRYTDASTAN
ncbi:baeRF2 domain-containing protein [Modestobacter altitudinis]|uniref:baeRF2 domain-containing protein n=1 Tax=Modestobacter altitudinis TaxID=2213158 RepID=UPI00110CA9CE|nr:Vms1/Ankzf1 family peptidyl-tRNA hydrolase [Modestobacter altitudinis]